MFSNFLIQSLLPYSYKKEYGLLARVGRFLFVDKNDNLFIFKKTTYFVSLIIIYSPAPFQK